MCIVQTANTPYIVIKTNVTCKQQAERGAIVVWPTTTSISTSRDG